MKNDSGIVADRGFTGAVPSGAPKNPRFLKKLVLIATSALFFCAALGLAQSANAEDSLRVADISAALRGTESAKPAQPQQQTANDDAFSALNAFAQQIKATAPAPASIKTSMNSGNQVDDQALSALQDFAKRLGTAQPESIKALPKLAEADNLLDFLKGGGASAPADKPKALPDKSKRSGPHVEAQFVGGKVCATCHSPLIAEFQKTLMGRISLTQKGKFECENCHGPGSEHVKAGGGRGVGGIMGFGPTDPRSTAEKNEVCLTCHKKGDRTYWDGSTHETRGLACTNCHTVMKEVSRKHNLKTAFEPDTCFQCHKDRRAQMARTSHMPLREGKMVCSDCHNPHGSATESLLRANSINDTCYKCHAEKRGPFLFEHAPVRENCDNCHDPHGSINEYMLKISRPRLCTECHAFGHLPGSAQAVQAISRQCQNCHTEIHGTNSPSGPLLHR